MARTYRRWHYRTAVRCSVTGKASFRSTTSARAFVESRDNWDGDVARVYRCEWCDWYHLTCRPTRWELARAA